MMFGGGWDEQEAGRCTAAFDALDLAHQDLNAENDDAAGLRILVIGTPP